jgi:putative N6-adenine-specific DNA methylase
MNRAPGLSRSFAFQRFIGFDGAAYEARCAVLSSKVSPPTHALRGTDLHAGSLGTARRNARRAGVLEHLWLDRQDACAIHPPPEISPGLLVMNLPYGIRVGEQGELHTLYRNLGRHLSTVFRGWQAGFLVADEKFETLAELRADSVHSLKNGGIPVRLVLVRL